MHDVYVDDDGLTTPCLYIRSADCTSYPISTIGPQGSGTVKMTVSFIMPPSAAFGGGACGAMYNIKKSPKEGLYLCSTLAIGNATDRTVKTGHDGTFA